MTIYLSGHVGVELVEWAHLPRLGAMLGPASGYLADVERFSWWAADNGCFTQGDSFDPERWLEWLDRVPRSRCLFAALPDVPFDPTATWERSAPYADVVHGMGFPAALVAQDGLVPANVPWGAIGALFIGGTTEWKLSEPAYRLVAEARDRGLWTHVGRVNSWKRLRAVASAGVDSVDGTFARFGPSVRVPDLVGWLRRLDERPFLESRPA